MTRKQPFRPKIGGDPPHLAGREEERRVFLAAIKALADGGPGPDPIVVYGPRGAGKTALLRWFGKECRKVGLEPVSVSSNRIKDVGDVPKLFEDIAGDVPNLFEKAAGGAPSGPEDPLIGHLAGRLAQNPGALLVDEAHDLTDDVLRRLADISRRVAAAAPFLLIVAGRPLTASNLAAADAAFMDGARALPVGRLSEKEAGEAITEPLAEHGIRIDATALAAVVDDALRFPYFLQMWGAGIWEMATEMRSKTVTLDILRECQGDLDKKRGSFFNWHYDKLPDSPFLPAASHVAAWRLNQRGSLKERELREIIDETLPPDCGERGRQVEEILAGLERSDAVWRPRGDFEPGIPGFTYHMMYRSGIRLKPRGGEDEETEDEDAWDEDEDEDEDSLGEQLFAMLEFVSGGEEEHYSFLGFLRSEYAYDEMED